MQEKGKDMSERFDVIVIGAGPGGEVAADRLHHGGMRVAMVERELIGGECAYWACIPSWCKRSRASSSPIPRWARLA